MSDPIANRQFRHYLNFLNDDIGQIEISEPVKFDASQFVLEQDANGYRRDVMFMSEEVSLEFYNGVYEPNDIAYLYQDGTYVFNLTHAFDKLKHYYQTYGTEMQVEYILEKNGLQFTTGEMLMETTDELTYFKFKVIQRTNLALLKRREDIKIDGFATEDLDGNEIEPLTTENILLKAKPVVQGSDWTSSTSSAIGLARLTNNPSFGINNVYVASGCNNIFNVNSYGIENTLSFISSEYALNSFGFPVDGLSFTYIESLDDLENLTITISDIDAYITYSKVDISGAINTIDGYVRLVVKYGDKNNTSGDGLNEIVLFEQLFNENTSVGVYSVDSDYSTSFDLPRDNRIWIYFEHYLDVDYNMSETITVTISTNLSSGGVIEMTATSIAIDTVIKGVRWIDLLKQSVKACNGQNVIARDFDEGAEHNKLFAFSGNLIRGRDDVPFYFTYKDRRENLMLLNMDAQVNENEVYVGYYSDYYANVDNGGYSLVPDQDATVYFNERYMCNSFEYAFKNYEKDRDEQNTLDSVHTESQWANTNKKVENVKGVVIGDAFDTYYIEAQRRQESKVTTALDGDDKIFGLDCIELAPSARGGFSASLTHNIIDGQLKLLKSANLPSWSVLGFNTGADFNILSGQNQGSYTVAEIEDTVLTLDGSGFTFEGVSINNVDYPLQNVQWTNRTNEGFSLISGILNPQRYANLRYTMRRNMKHWESFISSCSLYNTDNTKNTFYKNNPNLITQLTGEDEVVESADLVLSEIESPIVSARECERSIVIGYEDAITLYQKYQAEATLGGFIRLQNNEGRVEKVYPKRLGYTWATNVMEITGEIKQEPLTVTITKEGSTIYINEVGYDLESLPETFYKANGDYVVLFDENNVNLINFTKYDKFIVQEETFDNSIDLVQAIIDL